MDVFVLYIKRVILIVYLLVYSVFLHTFHSFLHYKITKNIHKNFVKKKYDINEQ
jgi:hypothetical protein